MSLITVLIPHFPTQDGTCTYEVEVVESLDPIPKTRRVVYHVKVIFQNPHSLPHRFHNTSHVVFIEYIITIDKI